MRISVIIPTWQRPDDLIRCLQALRGQQRLPDEVLVALREDDSETLVVLATWDPGPLPVRIVSVGLSDASEARNRCLDVATGDVLVLTDDDTAPRRDFLALIRGHFVAEPTLGGLGGPDWIGGVELPEAERASKVGRVTWWGRQIGNHHRGARQVQEVQWLKGANMSLRREALGGLRFGEGLRGRAAQFAEDMALSLQVHRAGWRVLYDPAVAVDHFPGRLAPGSDHRTLQDAQSLTDATFNETVALLDYLSLPSRAAFLVYHTIIGTRLQPGPVMATYLLLSTGSFRAFARVRHVLRGRFDGWTAWRRDKHVPVASRVSPTLAAREPVETGSS